MEFYDYIGDIYNDIFKNKNIISSFIFDINIDKFY